MARNILTKIASLEVEPTKIWLDKKWMPSSQIGGLVHHVVTLSFINTFPYQEVFDVAKQSSTVSISPDLHC